MAKKRSQSQAAIPERKRQSLEQASSEDENESSSTQFIKQKEDIIKDCLAYLLAYNSTLLPVRKNDIISKFGNKVGRKDRNAILKIIKNRLQKVGVCMKDVDGNRFILVNMFPRNLISCDSTPERQFLCFLLSLIAFNRGSIPKTELENCLSKLGIDLQTIHPYFGNISKSIQLFEKQFYLSKSLSENTIFYQWGMRAKCEIDKDTLSNCFEQIIGVKMDSLPQISVAQIALSEYNMVSDQEEDD